MGKKNVEAFSLMSAMREECYYTTDIQQDFQRKTACLGEQKEITYCYKLVSLKMKQDKARLGVGSLCKFDTR